MVSKTERTIGARIVLDEDGTSVLSAFKTVVTEVLDDDGSSLSSARRDVDLDPAEVATLFGATIDAHVTATNAAKSAADRDKAALEVVILEKDAALAAKEAELVAVAAELAQLKSEVEPV